MMLTHTLRKVVLVSLVGLAAGVCGTANAVVGTVTADLGEIGVGPPTIFQGTLIPGGAFIDTFTFSLPANGGSGYSVLNFPVTVEGTLILSTLFTSMKLFSDTDGNPFNNSGEILLAHADAPGNTESLSLTFGPTAGGHMFLVVDGITNGSLGGLYSGAISVSPVPEPTVWAMMLGGLGLLGWVRLRRGSTAYLR
jgi:hypothetical protein